MTQEQSEETFMCVFLDLLASLQFKPITAIFDQQKLVA